MLFNSIEFLFGFLPVVLVVFHLLRHFGRTRAALASLVGASLVFYGWWEPYYLILIAGSVLFNYMMAHAIARRPDVRWRVWIGVTVNLAILAYTKYSGFVVLNLTTVFGANWEPLDIALPLAISFFTFQQIAYLIDVARGEALPEPLVRYALFVTFFPQLIAGPIVHHSDIMPQFARALDSKRPPWPDLILGAAVMSIGLFKKVVLADKMSFWSDRVFGLTASALEPSFLDAWIGTLCFSLQIYFDFSGYSDIALGLALMIGIRLPLNFFSPYQAGSIIEFWRRWHMTLSRFLRDYLYYPLGGNRLGPARRSVNLMVVMALGGLWHGAGWTFILWGLLHGTYLLLNHALRSLFGYIDTPHFLGRILSRLVVFILVAVSWVLFRAESLRDAVEMYQGLIGMNGVVLPSHYQSYFGVVADTLTTYGVVFGTVPTFGGGWQVIWVIGLVLWVLLLPNTAQIMRTTPPALSNSFDRVLPMHGLHWIRWRSGPLHAMIAALVAIYALFTLLEGIPGEFIYFQF